LSALADELHYSVPGMHCAHCERAVRTEVLLVDGVEGVDVDLESKIVVVHGEQLDDVAVHGAIDEAGYEAARRA
jgi:copper chaperone